MLCFKGRTIRKVMGGGGGGGIFEPQEFFFVIKFLVQIFFRPLHEYLGGVYMTPGRLSRRDEFTPVPSHGSTFVYMIPPRKVMPARVAPA